VASKSDNESSLINYVVRRTETWVLNKCICRNFIHSYYVRGAVSPKPSTVDYVPAVRRTYVQKIVETRAHATEVEYPLLRACSSSTALTAVGLHTHVRTHRTSSDPANL
jgi:hypothetical protein